VSTGGGPLMPRVAVCVSQHPNCLGGCTGAGLGVADNCCCDTTLWSRQVGEAFDGCALTDVGSWVPVGLWVCALTDHLHLSGIVCCRVGVCLCCIIIVVQLLTSAHAAMPGTGVWFDFSTGSSTQRGMCPLPCQVCQYWHADKHSCGRWFTWFLWQS
jgi:hypothetical protein